MSTLVSTLTKSWGRLDTFHIVKNHSTTRCGELLQPEMAFVLVVLGNKFEELIGLRWTRATFKPAVKFLSLHLLGVELLALESDVPAGFVLHGDSPELMTVTGEVRNGDNVPEYTLLFRRITPLQTVFLAGRVLIM